MINHPQTSASQLNLRLRPIRDPAPRQHQTRSARGIIIAAVVNAYPATKAANTYKLSVCSRNCVIAST